MKRSYAGTNDTMMGTHPDKFMPTGASDDQMQLTSWSACTRGPNLLLADGSTVNHYIWLIIYQLFDS